MLYFHGTMRPVDQLTKHMTFGCSTPSGTEVLLLAADALPPLLRPHSALPERLCKFPRVSTHAFDLVAFCKWAPSVGSSLHAN